MILHKMSPLPFQPSVFRKCLTLYEIIRQPSVFQTINYEQILALYFSKYSIQSKSLTASCHFWNYPITCLFWSVFPVVFKVPSFKSCVHASIIAVILSIWRSKGDTRTSSRLSPLLSNRCPTSAVTYHKQ